MEREGHEHEDERVERLVARLRALDAAAPERLREAVVEAVANAAEPDGPPVPEATAPGAGAEPAAADPDGSAPTGPGPGGGVRAAPSRLRRRRRRPLAWAGGAAAALALVALLLVLVLPGGDGGAGAPTVPQVAAAAMRAPDGPAPSPAAGGRLDVDGDGIPFPDWSAPAAGGWRAAGTRSDRVGDRDVTTVVYEDGAGRRVGYAIAAAPELPIGGRRVERGGMPLWVYELDGATAVTWLREGRTCVVVASGVPERTLLDLAAPYGA